MTENFKRETRENRKLPTKKNIAGNVKPGKPPVRKYGFICPVRRVGVYR